MSSKNTNKSPFSNVSNLIMAKNETTQQERRNEQKKKEFIPNNNDANVLANVLQQEVGFQDLTNITKEEATKIKDDLLKKIQHWVYTADFNNDVNNMFKLQFLPDVFQRHQNIFTSYISKNLGYFKNKIIQLAEDRLTALSNSNWLNTTNLTQEEMACYSGLENACVQLNLQNDIGLRHLQELSQNEYLFKLFKDCSILATISPVLNKVLSEIQAQGQLDNIKTKYTQTFKHQKYKKTFSEENLNLFYSGFEMNCSICDQNTKNASWLEKQIIEIAKVRLNCDITKCENWKTIQCEVRELSKCYPLKAIDPQIWIDQETKLLKEICEGVLTYLNKQIEQNQYLRDDKKNNTIIEEKSEEESKSNEAENKVSVANNEKNDNKEDEKKDIDNNEKNGAIEGEKQSNPSSKNDIGINEEVQENSNSVNENELEVIDLYVDENKPNNKEDEKKDIDSKQDEKNREMEEEKQSNASSKKNSKSNNSCVDENEFGVINFNLNNNDGNHNNIVNQHQNENNNDRVLESLTVNYFAGNNNINNNVGEVTNNTVNNNENNTNRDTNNNIVNSNANNNENEQNIINEPRDEIPEVDTQIELNNNDLQQIYNRNFNINTLRERGLNPQNRISFTADAMKNIQPRCGIACLFSKKANLENTLYETIQRNRQHNNDRPTIVLQELDNIINTAGGCC